MARVLAVLLGAALVAAGCTESQPVEDVVVDTTPAIRAPRAPGFDGSTVMLLVLADLSGPSAEVDRERVAGIETYWAARNALGGFDGRYPVELLVRDHAGDPVLAVQAVTEFADEVLAVAHVSEEVVDVVGTDIEAAGLVMVPGAATATTETASNSLAHGLAIEALLVSLLDQEPEPGWCVVADQSALGSRVIQRLDRAAELAGIDAPLAYDVTNSRLTAELEDAGCRRVLVEVVADSFSTAAEAMPPEVTVFARSAIGHGRSVPAGVDLVLADDGTTWERDASAGMAQLLDALAVHSPDADPDPRLRAGYASQIQLDALVASGFQAGDVVREALLASAAEMGLVELLGLSADVDRSADPPELARQLRLFRVVGGEGLGWQFLGGHRATQVDALVAEAAS